MQGHVVFSPITMTHPIDQLLAKAGETLGSTYWVNFDEAFMNACAEMYVMQIDGWEASEGIRREIDHFQKRGKPIKFIPVKD